MQEFITQYETELNTGEREVPLMKKLMGEDYELFFNE